MEYLVAAPSSTVVKIILDSAASQATRNVRAGVIWLSLQLLGERTKFLLHNDVFPFPFAFFFIQETSRWLICSLDGGGICRYLQHGTWRMTG